MKIELRNVKHAKFASEETECFEATVVLDGVVAGKVSNDGHGGSDMFHPYALQERLDAYGKTLPEKTITSMTNDDGTPYTYAQDAESLVGDVLADWLTRRDLKRLMRTRVLFVRTDGKLYEAKVAKPAHARAIAHYKAKPDVAKVLNALPEDEALALYVTHGAP